MLSSVGLLNEKKNGINNINSKNDVTFGKYTIQVVSKENEKHANYYGHNIDEYR